MFTASQKTLAFGLPLINTIFENSPNLASYCTPLLFVHPLQLILGSMLVPRLSEYVVLGDETDNGGDANGDDDNNIDKQQLD